MTKLFGEPKDAEDAQKRKEYVDYMRWVEHSVASMEIIMFPPGAWGLEAKKVHAFRQRASQQ